MRKFARSFFLIAASLLGAPGAASATYSITAADTAAKEVGGAGASCVPYEVVRIYGVAKGHGAVNAQANFDDEALALAVELLGDGADPASVLAEITDAEAHPAAPKMQWGIVDVEGRSARATGPLALAYAADMGGSAASGRFVFTVQGNILTSSLALEQSRSAFEAEGCDLADRLVRGLEAAGLNGEGDSRCTDEGRPAKSAYVDVTGPEGTRLHISVPDVSPEDPIPVLRAAYDAWRIDHPCPAIVDASPAPGVEAEGGCSITSIPPRRGGPRGGILALVFGLCGAALYCRSRRLALFVIKAAPAADCSGREHGHERMGRARSRVPSPIPGCSIAGVP
jgi:uncharacterized Ntn-hydrolase superfamily protein